MLKSPPICDFGWKAPGFDLPATDGRSYSLKDIAGPNGTLIVFICNHCPYVVGVVERLVRDLADLKSIGIGIAAISANDAVAYPQDSFENMKLFAQKHGFGFPYLYDESQDAARAYGAKCTPDFFGFNAELGLQYRGRLDSARNSAPDSHTRRELVEAMKLVAETGKGPLEQVPSMGCSIKWK